jgi:hypothetical protein
MLRETDCVTVCDNCLQASCWQGIFMCWESRDAGTVEMTVSELRLLSLEHERYWIDEDKDPDGVAAPANLRSREDRLK